MNAQVSTPLGSAATCVRLRLASNIPGMRGAAGRELVRRGESPLVYTHVLSVGGKLSVSLVRDMQCIPGSMCWNTEWRPSKSTRYTPGTAVYSPTYVLMTHHAPTSNCSTGPKKTATALYQILYEKIHGDIYR